MQNQRIEIREGNTKVHLRGDKPHRIDGPAVERPSGQNEWWILGSPMDNRSVALWMAFCKGKPTEEALQRLQDKFADTPGVAIFTMLHQWNVRENEGIQSIKARIIPHLV